MVILSGDTDRIHYINFIQVWLFTKLVCRLYTRKQDCITDQYYLGMEMC